MNVIDEIEFTLFSDDCTYTLSASTDPNQFLQAMRNRESGECFVGVYDANMQESPTINYRAIQSKEFGEFLSTGYFLFSTLDVASFTAHLLSEKE